MENSSWTRAYDQNFGSNSLTYFRLLLSKEQPKNANCNITCDEAQSCKSQYYEKLIFGGSPNLRYSVLCWLVSHELNGVFKLKETEMFEGLGYVGHDFLQHSIALWNKANCLKYTSIWYSTTHFEKFRAFFMYLLEGVSCQNFAKKEETKKYQS